jgi:glutathione S-transferase
LFPSNFLASLESKAPNFYKWASAVVKEDSVTYIWDEKNVAERTLALIERMKAAAK